MKQIYSSYHGVTRVDPAEAVEIHQLMSAKRTMGIFWGTYGCKFEVI